MKNNKEIRRIADKATFSGVSVKNLASLVKAPDFLQKIREDRTLNKEVKEFLEEASQEEKEQFLQLVRNDVTKYLVENEEWIMEQDKDLRNRMIQNYSSIFSKENAEGEFNQKILQELQKAVQVH